MRRANTLLVLLAIAALLQAGCRPTHSDTASLSKSGPISTTSVHHEPGCPLTIVEASTALSDSALVCSLTVKSATKSSITSFVLNCSLVAAAGETRVPVAPPIELNWEGLIAPTETASIELSSPLIGRSGLNRDVAPGDLEARIEPESVTLEGGGGWKRTGPVPQ
jgi:hypothetical protein